MTIRVLRSRATESNPKVVERVRERDESNLAWIIRVIKERHVEIDGKNWSLLWLTGGNDPLSFRLRVAQSHVRHDLSPSAWSHVAFVSELNPNLAESRLREISLAPAAGFGLSGFAPPQNGLQENRLGAYAAADRFPNVALLSVPVATADIDDALDDLAKQRSMLDAPQLILRWLGYCWGVGVPASPLSEACGIPSAAILEAAFAAKGLDLTPGLESRSSCPEAIWQAATWWYEFYQKTAKRQAAISGAYSAKHDLIPEERLSERSPEPRLPQRAKGRSRAGRSRRGSGSR